MSTPLQKSRRIGALPLHLLLTSSGLLLASLASPVSAAEDASIMFAAPPWPGVTMKTEIASEIFEALGYSPSTRQLGAQITYEGMSLGEVDVYLAAWLPGQSTMYNAAMEKDAMVDFGNNVNGARANFAVPRYVAEAGVTSLNDVDKPEFADKFEKTIYSIEIGSGSSEIANRAVDEDIYGLGDWDLKESSTAGMLGTVANAIKREEWVMFVGWTPHWMGIEYDMVFLDDPKDLWGPGGGESDVRTLANKKWSEAHPNASVFLDQIAFTSEEQSALIFGYGKEERPQEEVAGTWMKANPAKVKGWLDGVTTRDGEPAWPAVQEALGLPDA
ncbi:ABC transporter substrate-binding protein [Cobetia sp. L2A1]|uniref:ABC transporter substrate-binding protein n=1 Tax=Cobetia sp. L2A1 TaxID=2686360 RepID=UPI00131A786F|nr:ABC transporter substrate-binding protein [Cobetia sp. L2A1]